MTTGSKVSCSISFISHSYSSNTYSGVIVRESVPSSDEELDDYHFDEGGKFPDCPCSLRFHGTQETDSSMLRQQPENTKEEKEEEENCQ